MAHRELAAAILAFLREQPAGRCPTASEITAHVVVSRPTVNRHLHKLVKAGQITREHAGRATGYRLAMPAAPAPAKSLREYLLQPLAARAPVSYQRAFVDDYVPNDSALLPRSLAEQLHRDGRALGRQPAGTYARKVLEQLLIDLSWHSSRLEGNRMSLLDTRELFARGRTAGNDTDSVMLLNHKEAIEFLVDAVPEQGITTLVVRNLHSLLMQGLLDDPNAVGAIRRKIVHIEHSVYVPSQVPGLLDEMLATIVAKVQLVRNPIEAAFFLWIHVAYLQPFEDGNKRTSRLSANLPLLLNNCAPLSFLDVDRDDYALAMLGVYERRDAALAVELFEATYRRSITKYQAVRQAMGAPDPLRVKYREPLGEAMRRIVTGEPLATVLDVLGMPAGDRAAFTGLVREELAHLEPYNCARYRLAGSIVERWIAAGRSGM